MSETKNTGVFEPAWIYTEPTFQYLEYKCSSCGEIWLETYFIKGGNLEDYFISFVCCGKDCEIPFPKGKYVLEKPVGKIVSAELVNPKKLNINN